MSVTSRRILTQFSNKAQVLAHVRFIHKERLLPRNRPRPTSQQTQTEMRLKLILELGQLLVNSAPIDSEDSAVTFNKYPLRDS